MEFRATPGNDFFSEGELGGFTTALALAADENEYQQQVTAYFTDLGVEVVGFERVEPLTKRLSSHPSMDDETIELAVELSDALPVTHESAIYSYSPEEDGEEGESV